MEYINVFDQDMRLLAVLDNADNIGYELKHNDLWTASFSLPAGDPKNSFCQAHNLIRLPDGPRDTGLFRIIGMPSGEETGIGGKKTYSLEHVMATLLDDVLFGYHETGGTGLDTRQVMVEILSYQTTPRWQMGVCEFQDYFQYHFENVSLLSALLSLGEVLTDEYTWDFDTETEPWTVNLRRADTTPGCGIHYGRNLVKITKAMDATALITRLYPLGYGEGVNQLTIKEVNNGAPYIDADTIGTWGAKCSVWTDTRIQDAATLKARARQVLEGYKNPYISYTAKAVDLYGLTGFSWDNYMPGKLVKVMDGEHGINFNARIVNVSKRDVNGDPGDIEITIANAPRDAADSINTLADRVGIGELYSQGATNLFAIPFADNADARHPAKFRVYIPEGMVRINKMLLSWQIAAFRAYSTGAAAGGSSTRTSSSGGGSTQTTTSNDTVVYSSEYGGDCVITEPQRVVAKNQDSGTAQIGHTFGPRSSLSGVEKTNTDANASGVNTGSAGGHRHAMGHTHEIASHSHSFTHYHNTPTHYHTVDSHAHGMNNHRHHFDGSGSLQWGHQHSLGSSSSYTGGVRDYADKSLAVSGYTDSNSGWTGDCAPNTNGAAPETGWPLDSLGNSMWDTYGVALETGGARASGDWRPYTDDASDHAHSLTPHVHAFDHYHRIASFTIPELSLEVPAHGHNVRIPGHTHSVTIPAHTHDLTLPDHNHGVVYGIYEWGRASSVSILVDGTAVPAQEITSREIDVAQWLSKDAAGRIRRGTWHEIQIVPDQLTRIEANLTAQVFVQSTGGGDY